LGLINVGNFIIVLFYCAFSIFLNLFVPSIERSQMLLQAQNIFKGRPFNLQGVGYNIDGLVSRVFDDFFGFFVSLDKNHPFL